jgi:anti-sigma factor RsiW
MNRVEELTLRLVDGQITSAEREELARLVTGDREARRAHLALMTIEATLRGRGRVEVSDQVMSRIDEERTSRIVRVVMGEPTRARPKSWWERLFSIGRRDPGGGPA